MLFCEEQASRARLDPTAHAVDGVEQSGASGACGVLIGQPQFVDGIDL
jgi:hypothetical protein